MNLTNKRAIQNILAKYGLRPNRRLGQHFLISRSALNKIVETAELGPDDVVLEIGPGIGTLTMELAKKASRVIAIEKDQKMCGILKETLKNFKNIEIVQADILKIDIDSYICKKFVIRREYKVVANLPYYITSPVIRMFLERDSKLGKMTNGRLSFYPIRPGEMILMVQKEVAQRICPRPPKLKERRRGKTSKMNLLAVSVQFYAKPKIISYVPKTAFWPRPKVDSAILKITPNNANRNTKPHKFFRIVKAGFSSPRKQLINNLSRGLGLKKNEARIWLQKSGISPEQRAESLTVGDWIKLVGNYSSK